MSRVATLVQSLKKHLLCVLVRDVFDHNSRSQVTARSYSLQFQVESKPFRLELWPLRYLRLCIVLIQMFLVLSLLIVVSSRHVAVGWRCALTVRSRQLGSQLILLISLILVEILGCCPSKASLLKLLLVAHLLSLLRVVLKTIGLRLDIQRIHHLKWVWVAPALRVLPFKMRLSSILLLKQICVLLKILRLVNLLCRVNVTLTHNWRVLLWVHLVHYVEPRLLPNRRL